MKNNSPGGSDEGFGSPLSCHIHGVRVKLAQFGRREGFLVFLVRILLLWGGAAGSLPAQQVAFTSTPEAWAVKGGVYRYTPVVSNSGTAPVTFTVLEKPSWLGLSGALLSGTPPDANEGLNELVILRATNGNASSADQSFRIRIGRLVGPVALPPGGGAMQWVTGMPKAARSGGDSLLVTGAVRAADFPIFWGLLPNGFGMKMNYVGPSGSSGSDFTVPGGFSFAAAEVGQWSAAASTPAGGLGIWTAQTNRPASIGGAAVATFLRAEVRNIADTAALPFSTGDGLGVAASVGALARIPAAGDLRIGLRLHANAAYPSGTAALDWFNALASKLPTDRTVTQLSSGFYWVNTPPRLTVNAGIDVAQDGTAVLGAAHLNALDQEDGAGDIRFEIGNNTNGSPPQKGTLQWNGPGGWTPLGAAGVFTRSDLEAGKIRYVHGGSYDVADGFQFRVLDAQGTAARDGDFTLFTFPIRVTPVNHPPVAANQTVNSGLGATIAGQLSFSDPDSGFIPQTFAFTLPSSTLGTLTLVNPATGSFSFQAGAGAGTEMISWQVSDGGFTRGGTLTLVVANQTPVVQPLSVTGTTSGVTSGTLVVQDTDLPAQILTMETVGQPAKGTVVVNGLGFSYTPAAGRFGQDSFTVKVTDALGAASAVQTVSLTIRPASLGSEAVFVSARLGGGTVPQEGVIHRINPANGDLFTLGRNLGKEARGMVWSAPLQKLLLLVEAENAGVPFLALVKVDPLTGAWSMADIVTSNGQLAFPVGLASDGPEHVLVANGPGGVVRVNLATGAQETLALGLPAGAFVTAAVPAPDGTPVIWVTSIGNLGTAGDGAVFSCNRTTGMATSPVAFSPVADASSLTVSGPSALAVARAGVPVETFGVNPVSYSPHGGAPVAPWSLPLSLARSAVANIWLVTDPFASKLYRQSTSSTVVSEVAVPGLGAPFGLAVVAAPVLQVTAAGGAVVTAGGTFDMGSTSVFGSAVSRGFTLTNSGTAPLVLGGNPLVEIIGPDPAEFTVVGQPAASVPPGGSTTFGILFDPSASGLRSATVRFVHDQTGSSPFTFTIQGTATEPEIAVFDGIESPGTALTNGQTTPVDFGSHGLPMLGSSRSFTIKNTGNGPLNITFVSVFPMGAYQVQSPASSTLAAGETGSILVRFSSNTAGAYPGTLSITSNATMNSIFSIPITGAALDLTPPQLTQVSISGSGGPSGGSMNYVRDGGMISLGILSNEPIQPPVVQICGRTATVGESFGGTSWYAWVNVDSTFPQGIVAISVTATDLAGNTAPAVTMPTSGMLTVDTIPPVVTSAMMSSSNAGYSNPGWARAGDTIFLSVTTDESARMPVFTVFGSPWWGMVTGFGSYFSLTTDPITTEPEGPVAFTFQCTDLAGNVSAVYSTVPFLTPVKVDRTPPIITGPGNLTVEAAGPSGAMVGFVPTATDAQDPAPALSANPAPGSLFPLGQSTVSLGAMDVAGNSSTGSFQISVLAAADFWRHTHFSQTGNSGAAADDADPDGDGLTNLVERAFNLPPLAAGSPQLGDVPGITGLPRITVQGTGPEARLHLEFIRRKASSAAGLGYFPQFSSNLAETGPGAWTAPAGPEVVTSLNDQWEKVTLTDSEGGALRKFGRVKIGTAVP